MLRPTHYTSDGDSLVLTVDGEYVDIYLLNRSVDEPCATISLEDLRIAVLAFDYEIEENLDELS